MTRLTLIAATAAAVLVPAGATATRDAPQAQAATAPSGSILFVGGPGTIDPETRLLQQGVYAVDAQGGRPKELVPGSVLSAGWSPDGRRLAFTRPSERPDGSADLYVTSRDRTSSRRLAQAAEFTWSPDGRRIAYVELAGADETLWVVEVDSAARRRLTVRGGRHLAWSPDGRRIAFVRDYGLYVADARTRRTRRIARGLRAFGYLSWSPDSARLAFYPCCVEGFAVVDADGSYLRRPVKQGVLLPSWSPNGAWIALSGDLPGNNGKTVQGTFVVRPDGSGFRRISARGGSPFQPSWSPDSRALGVADRCCAAPDIWAITVASGAARRLTDGRRYGYGNHGPEWHPRARRTDGLPGRYVEAANPTDSVVTPGLVRARGPISYLGADGTSAVYDTGRCEAWTRGSGLVAFRYGRCNGFAGSRVATSANSPAMGGDNWVLTTSTLAVPAFVFVTWPGGGTAERNLPVTAFTGDGELLVFSTWGPCRVSQDPPCAHEPKRDGTLWRVDGAHAVALARSAGALTPLSVDTGRILVDREDGRLELLRADGSSMVGFAYAPGNLRGAQVEAGDVVLLTQGTLEHFDAATGVRLHEWPLAAGEARLEDVANGVAVYVSGSHVYVVRLSDGTTVALPSRGTGPRAQLERAGLWYAYRVDDAAYPGRVAFVPFDELPLR